MCAQARSRIGSIFYLSSHITWKRPYSIREDTAHAMFLSMIETILTWPIVIDRNIAASFYSWEMDPLHTRMSYPLGLLELPQTISKGTQNAANPLLPNLFQNSIRVPINMAFTHLLRSQQNYLVNAQCTRSQVNFIVVSVRFAINDLRRNRPRILYLRLKHGLSIMSQNWYVITQPNHNFKSGWVKPPLVFGHGWVIACHISMLLTDIMN